MNPVEAWAIVDKDGRIVEIGICHIPGGPLPMWFAIMDSQSPSRAPHTAVKGEWRPTNDVAR
jgi:hypothetical protein